MLLLMTLQRAYVLARLSLDINAPSRVAFCISYQFVGFWLPGREVLVVCSSYNRIVEEQNS
jgi:hypothetical protein